MNAPPPGPTEQGPPEGPEDRFRFHKHALMWLGRVAISAIAGVVVMTLYGPRGYGPRGGGHLAHRCRDGRRGGDGGTCGDGGRLKVASHAQHGAVRAVISRETAVVRQGDGSTGR